MAEPACMYWCVAGVGDADGRPRRVPSQHAPHTSRSARPQERREQGTIGAHGSGEDPAVFVGVEVGAAAVDRVQELSSEDRVSASDNTAGAEGGVQHVGGRDSK